MEYQIRPSLLPLTEYIMLDPVEQIFANRGFTKDDIYHYLNTSQEDIIDPATIKYMQEGVKLLIKHINNDDKIFVQVDSDCDGYTSAALLLNYLHLLFPGFVENNILYDFHDGKQHGLTDNIPKDTKLVIAPDSSSNDYDIHKELHDKGIDVLVVDHHHAEKYSPYAVTINNQLCDYPTKSLSGVGMVLKFCQYIDQLLDKDYSDYFYDLAAFGIIADVMDVRDFETREIIKRGTKNVHNKLFYEICKMQDYSISNHGGLNPFTVGWYISPLVNAITRSGTQEEKKLFFDAMLDWKADLEIPSTKRGCKGQMETMAEQACRTARNIKAKQDKQRDEGYQLIDNMIQKQKLNENKILAVKMPASINRNFTGLIANQLLSKYKQPILLLSPTTGPDGSPAWEGSARSYEYEGLENFKEFMNSQITVYLAEGHPSAFGVGIYDSDFDDFIKDTNEDLKDCTFNPSHIVDFVWDVNSIDKNAIMDISDYDSIWGKGLERPEILIKDIIVTKDTIKLMSPEKYPTIKILLPNGVEAIKRYSSIEEYESLVPEVGKVNVMNIVGTCAVNTWGGKLTPQIDIIDYDSKMMYYF